LRQDNASRNVRLRETGLDMIQKNNFTLRLDDAKRQRVDKLASELDRSRSWVMQKALDDYLDRQDAIRAAIQKAVNDNEPAVDHATLMKALNKLIGGKT
jgi:predicted transcriptional regulator